MFKSNVFLYNLFCTLCFYKQSLKFFMCNNWWNTISVLLNMFYTSIYSTLKLNAFLQKSLQWTTFSLFLFFFYVTKYIATFLIVKFLIYVIISLLTNVFRRFKLKHRSFVVLQTKSFLFLIAFLLKISDV